MEDAIYTIKLFEDYGDFCFSIPLCAFIVIYVKFLAFLSFTKKDVCT